jgi:glycosyltransferase involved in cell wall biosynthesis
MPDAATDDVVTLDDLPPPPPDRTGWPWTEASDPVSETAPDGSDWPKISIVTPSYNQGQFIEETIRSILLQRYPNLEYIVMDGGSDDNTVEILEKYDPWINHWVSEPDEGQTHAIQKGFDRVSGTIWNWINSDDVLSVGALSTISKAWLEDPDATVYGGNLRVFRDGKAVRINDKLFDGLEDVICVWEEYPTPQPAIFMSVQACIQANGLETSLRYAMDYELYLRLCLLPDFKSVSIDDTLTNFRLHDSSKSVSERTDFQEEIISVFDRFRKNHPGVVSRDHVISRKRAEYHLHLTQLRDRFGGSIPLKPFLSTSLKYFNVVIGYRFFWSMLINKLK